MAIAEGVTDIKHEQKEGINSSFVASAFYGCSITTISIPASLVDFISSEYSMWIAPYDIFSSCSCLEEIIVDDGNTAFSSREGMLYDKEEQELLICPAGKKGSITIPASVTHIGNHNYMAGSCHEMLGYCGSLTEINVDVNNTIYSSQDGILYNKEKTELIRCPVGKARSISIPDGLTAINNYSFSGCANLTEITIPEGAASMEEGAFKDCSSLTGITISDGVETIGNYVFKGCSSLTGITIPKTVIQIGKNIYGTETDYPYLAFENCSSLESITIPELTSIPEGAFDDCAQNLHLYCVKGS